ncbi:IS1595 family transposase [Bacteroidales bacterium AH-315-N07]|nr:IS1595 family transposase [Bacteroidales bacterium AH-315-N07]
MVVEPRIELEGILEMDETYVGGKPRKKAPYLLSKAEKRKLRTLSESYDIQEGKYKKPYKKELPKRGRGTGKIPIVGIVERDGNVIAKVMRNLTSINLKDMVKKNVDKEESMVITDSYRGYNKLSRIVEHIKLDHKRYYSYKGINTNTIESFWAIIKRGITGQYHQVSLKYLPDYINEFVFKYNNRKEDDMFITLVRNSMENKSFNYDTKR